GVGGAVGNGRDARQDVLFQGPVGAARAGQSGSNPFGGGVVSTSALAGVRGKHAEGVEPIRLRRRALKDLHVGGSNWLVARITSVQVPAVLVVEGLLFEKR